ncbi:hypothetical protein [Dyella sp. 20L07]|uniref:hypothetical protein n=1 Tax=Dyella sp. 20L07 TaxID=3384240 RepID=UPI003D2DA4DD
MSLADYKLLVIAAVRDRDSVLSASDIQAAIDAAVQQYSLDAPRIVVVDQQANGSQRLALPAGWVEDASVLVSLEYPVDQFPPAELPTDQVRIYASPTQRQLLFPVDITPTDGELVRIGYSAPHTVTDDIDTIRVSHRVPVASLAASTLCGQLASYYASDSEPTIQADTVNRGDASSRWRARARDLAAAYSAVVGSTKSDRQRGASVTVEAARRDSLGGRRLFHPPGSWPR